TSDHLGKFEGKADEGYLVGYASNSKAYRVYNLTSKRVEESMNLRFMEDKPNVQGIAKDAVERYGYLFSQETADILSQAEADIWKNGVSAALDSDGKILSAGGISAGSDSAGSSFASGYPAGSVPVGGEKPAGSTEPAGSIPATSTSVSADSIPVYAEATTLSPGQSLGSSENTTRFLVPSDVCKDQLSSGIFTSSSYDDDFSATLTNLVPTVTVNPIPIKRVNTVHPQSQIIGDLASPV
nr:retrovirus-related Pol polyprotein from transposon TNT 1-94 [Tanacetum cinerariifolium]